MRGTTRHDRLPNAAMVEAARAGDERALEELAHAYLPLVYNVVGRALNGHPDVDDLVQETMLRVTRGMAGLKEPERFRSWLVAIAMHQIRDWWRGSRSSSVTVALPEAADVEDPHGDFVDLTILRLRLTGQRRETAEATRWLDREERMLLTLWWQEVAGQLTRAELAEATGVSVAHAGVRVQRLRDRLDVARRVVRALAGRPRCSGLTVAVEGWDGRPAALWRKRLARHVRDCELCAGRSADLAPVEGLLTGLGLVPLPAGFLFSSELLAGAGTSATGGVAAKGGGVAKLVGPLTAKPAALATLGVAGLAVGVALYAVVLPPANDGSEEPVTNGPTATVTAAGSPTPDPADPSDSDAPPDAPPPESASQDAVYGQTVDAAEPAPDPGTRPARLPARPEGRPVAAEDGRYRDASGGGYLMVYRDQYVVLSGQGYVRVSYELGSDGRRGDMVMPTWTGLTGRIFHVASGGGHRMDDAVPGGPSGTTWMGAPDTGYTRLPDGAQQMWQHEYFYLDGSVVLTQHERGSDYNLLIQPVSHPDVEADVNTAPGTAEGVVRYGVVRDTGGDDAPVPQYLTRERPADPVAEVPQRSEVGPE
ncbi:sigma-70 family RNA polymerase sigma factor [Streptomyces sp. NPDC127098]|uniref:sigma-70 family RNA polymerase sigma factor n=1 Tax=Streptomyces sp. NPDC127098 TaxID=3347137 RepID=UPI00366958EE